MKRPVSAKDREVPPGTSPDGETPLSASGVVVKRGAEEPVPEPAPSEPQRRRDSDPAYRLTPYRARFDVEMDDTAVSKVRDPSVSLVLGSDAGVRRRAKVSERRLDAIASLALGAALGALLVVVVVLVARAL
jgi:hypothetical protein